VSSQGSSFQMTHQQTNLHHESVTNLALSIDEKFSDHPGIVKVDEQKIVYFNKMSGTPSDLQLTISILDENGELSSLNLPRINVKTQLVYENGTPVPVMPMKPLKIRNKKKGDYIVRSQKPIFERTGGDVWLGCGEFSTLFNFLLHEVTYHHHGHEGFKVKASVYSSSDEQVVIHPAVLKEVITVLSKPKRVESPAKMHQDGIGSNLKLKLLTPVKEEEIGRKRNNPPSPGTPNPPKRGKLSTTMTGNENIMTSSNNAPYETPPMRDVAEETSDLMLNENTIRVPIGKIFQAYKCGGKCFACQTGISQGAMCEPAYHTVNCEFVHNLLPLFCEVEPSFMQSIEETFSQQQQLDQTLGSRSFEEYSKEQIANVPIEAIDADIFAGEFSISSNKWQDLANENEVQSQPCVNVRSHGTVSNPNLSRLDFRDALRRDTMNCVNRFKDSNDENGLQIGECDFDEDDIIAGKNIFVSRSADIKHLNYQHQDDISHPGMHFHHEADGFLSFLDHVSRGEGNGST
jgi:hypothetical protein